MLVVLAGAAALGPSLPERELMPPDEPRFALVAREMYERGDPVLLTRGGELYTDKPPLLFWAQSAAFLLLGGPGEAAARLPSLVATLALIALLHRTGRRWVGEPGATYGALAYLSCLLVLERGAWCSTDALLAVGVFGAVAALSSASAASGVTPSSSRAHAGVVAATWLAVGTLAKGPVAFAIVGIAALASWLLGAGLVSLRPLLRPLPLATLAALLFPWPLALVSRLGLGPPLEALWRQNVVRFVQSWDNLEPWWFQGWSLLSGLFPWTLLAGVALAPKILGPLLADRTRRWLALWPALMVVFFSIPAGKRGVYLLPIYPALALLIGSSLERIAEHVAARRAAAAGAVLVACVLGLLAGTAAEPAWRGSPLPPDLAEIGAVRSGAATVLGLMSAALLWSGIASWRGRPLAVVAGPTSFAILVGLLYPSVVTPALNAAQGARAFAEQAISHTPANARIGWTRNKWELIAWYTSWRGQRLDSPRAVSHFLADGESPAVAVGPFEELGPERDFPAGSRVADVGRLGRDRVAVVVRGLAKEREPFPQSPNGPVDKNAAGS
ncbi:MAG: glycosyltransferase family 39 protein [Acidobacteriota bacterium]|nr:MAG: glycosyltransferase family 39 protein [Acidobacteriota bacterium]